MSLPTLLDKLSATKHTWQGCKNLRSRNFVKRCKSCQCQPTQPFLRPNRETETETALSRVPSHFPHSGLRRAGAALSGGDYGLAVFVLPPISDSAAAARAWVDPPPTTPSEGGREGERRVFSAVKERNGGTFLGVRQWQKKEEVASFRMVFQLRRLTLPA